LKGYNFAKFFAPGKTEILNSVKHKKTKQVFLCSLLILISTLSYAPFLESGGRYFALIAKKKEPASLH
jgi:hypothetical protein